MKSVNPASLTQTKTVSAAPQKRRRNSQNTVPYETFRQDMSGVNKSKNERKQKIMNKTELVALVAEKASMTKKDAAVAVDATFSAITDAMVKGDKVQLVGFGTFETKHRAERTGKNPRTGEVLTIAAITTPSFKAGKALKDAVNSK